MEPFYSKEGGDTREREREMKFTYWQHLVTKLKYVVIKICVDASYVRCKMLYIKKKFQRTTDVKYRQAK